MTHAGTDDLTRAYIKRDRPQTRGYSQAVITAGGRMIWLAGQTALEDATGKSLAGDFEGQAREVFRRLEATLNEADASLTDMVTMTVFITDTRYADRFTQIRREIFKDDFPASALITIKGLGRPEMLLEIQGVAVSSTIRRQGGASA